MSGTTTLTVTAAVVTSIAVTPTNPSIVEGTTQQFTATGTFTDGTTGEHLTTSVTWTSSNLAVATINASGVATGLGAGSSTITATSGSVSGVTTLTVTATTVSAASVSWGAQQVLRRSRLRPTGFACSRPGGPRISPGSGSTASPSL